ncbi:MAG: nuclear transport factor 2 family protein [Cytophagales bacterium]|nr:nuclear transport factor 2 family protein [Cytophagales bacterium]
MIDQAQPDIEKIRTLKARYCRLLDTKQWEAFGRLLTENVVLEFYDTAGKLQRKVEGREEVMRQMPAYFKHAQTVHQVKHHEIELQTSTTATAIWAVEDIVTFFDPVRSPSAVIHGFGYYHERYEKSAGEWRIAGYRLERLKLDYTPWPAEHQPA